MPNLTHAGERNLFVSEDGVFYVVRKIHGRKRPLSLRTKDRRTALELRDKEMGVEKTDVAQNRTIKCDEGFKNVMKRRGDTARKKHLSETTCDTYESNWNNHVSTKLKTMRIVDVQPHHIREELDRFEAKRKPNGEPYAETTVHGFYTMLSSTFQSFTKGETHYRNDNPVRAMDDDDKPAQPEPTAVAEEIVHTHDSISKIADRLPKTDHGFILKHLILLLPLFGLRISEAVALKVIDYRPAGEGSNVVPLFGSDDEEEYGELHVLRQARRKRKAGIPSTWFKDLKGRKSTAGDKKRVVPVPTPEAKQLLDAYIAQGIEEQWLNPNDPEQLLFPSTRQTPLWTNHVWTSLQKAAAKAGYPIHVTSHHFRHVFITDRREDGNSWEDVATMVGHRDGGKLARVRYAHIDQKLFNRRIVANAKARRALQEAAAAK